MTGVSWRGIPDARKGIEPACVFSAPLCCEAVWCGMATGGTLALAAARACPLRAERTEHREALSGESKTGLASF